MQRRHVESTEQSRPPPSSSSSSSPPPPPPRHHHWTPPHREALLGQGNGWLQDPGQGPGAPHLHAVHPPRGGPGHGDGVHMVQGQVPTTGARVSLGAGEGQARGGTAAAVQRVHLARGRLVVQAKAVPADTRGAWLRHYRKECVLGGGEG
jgi:hypothetical protein